MDCGINVGNAVISAAFDSASHHLLWFRPVSPLNYAVPPALAGLTWGAQTHLPTDTLSPVPLAQQAIDALHASAAWFLSSPTAAHCLAKSLLAHGTAPTSAALAVVGQASLNAWLDAGGMRPKAVHISTSGESMGLLPALQQYPSVCVVRAQSGREDLPNSLRTLGVQVTCLAAYQKAPQPLFATRLKAALQSNGLSKVLCFTSSEQVATLVAAAGQGEELCDMLAWASHARVAQAASAAGFQVFER